ncbi:MAG: AI-2E family transporter [Oscillospiraceae bacterium]|nr:AI-2E family transporter [Oscillospiraceae bacterium]
MKFQFNSKYNTIAAYAVIVFAICLLLVMVAFRIEIFSTAFSKIIGVSSPIIWGFVIAYLLNPLVKKCEILLGKVINRKKEHKHLVRGLSVGICVLLLLSALAALIATIIPEIITNIQSISERVQDPEFLHQMELKIRSVFDLISEKTAFLGKDILPSFENLEVMLLGMLERFELNLDKLFSQDGLLANLTNGLMSVLNAVKNAFLGVIVSIYLLYSKEIFLAQSRKLVCAVCSASMAKRVFKFVSNVNKKFIGYFTGVALDCTLIGIVSFIFLQVTGMPYALLISVVLALTNAIPIFGPYIGSIPSFLLVLLFSPGKALIFLIFVIVLQQIDGNIIAPKILGDQLGLSAFWIMSAVFIGGGLFGLFGMIIASPMFAVIYSICSEFVSVRLEAKGIPADTASYMEPVGSDKPKKPEQTAPESVEASQSKKSAKK